MNILEIDPTTDPKWQALVESRESSVFHSSEWLRVLSETYDMPIRAHVMLNGAGGEASAGIPFVRIADMRGKRIRSLPFSDFCDPLVDDLEQWTPLIDRLIAEDAPILVRCVHNDVPLQDERFELVKKAKWHGVDLQRDVEEIWASLGSAARRAIRKAEKSGVTVRIADKPEDMRAFFELHLQIRKQKYRLLAQPYKFFAKIWEHFMAEDKGVLMLAVVDDKIIGGVPFLKWQDTFTYKFNTSHLDYLEYRPNDLVIWEGIQYGARNGFKLFDFGLSDWEQDGLIRFKQKFATVEKTLSFMEYEPEFEPTVAQKQAGGLFPQLTDLFTEEAVPDDITEQAGDLLYRFFA